MLTSAYQMARLSLQINTTGGGSAVASKQPPESPHKGKGEEKGTLKISDCETCHMLL